ncbi:polysaccharide deacetylase family protein [candidate division GN15 bacterium]|nr:polysaccharide deacetylase family protein [candidate division GN15 bacterium]
MRFTPAWSIFPDMKQLIKSTLYRMGLWKMAFRLRGRPTLAVFAFHRITDHSSAADHLLGYDRGQDVKEFTGQLDALAEYFEVISLETFNDCMNGTTEPKRHSALLTFDDADSEFIRYVLPELKRRQWPAVVFTPSDFVGGDKFFWHVWVGHLFLVMNKEDAERMKSLEDVPSSVKPVLRGIDVSTHTGRMKGCRALVSELNKLKDNDILQVVEKLKACCPAADQPTIHTMGWSDHKELVNANVSVQSHTASHRRLATLSREEMATELVGSKARLETELDEPVYAICYPQGSVNEVAVEESVEAGYSLGFTTEYGLCRYPVTGEKRLMLPRVDIWSGSPAEWHWSLGRLLRAPIRPQSEDAGGSTPLNTRL